MPPNTDEVPQVNGWNEWSNFVLEALKENRADHERILEKMDSARDEIKGIDKELAVMRVKAGMWGALAGAIPGLIIALITLATLL